MTSQHKTTVKELNKELKEVRTTLDDQRKLTQKETEFRKSIQERLLDAQKCIDELNAKNSELKENATKTTNNGDINNPGRW